MLELELVEEHLALLSLQVDLDWSLPPRQSWQMLQLDQIAWHLKWKLLWHFQSWEQMLLEQAALFLSLQNWEQLHRPETQSLLCTLAAAPSCPQETPLVVANDKAVEGGAQFLINE